MSITETRWITGEEFNTERRRLLDAGHKHDSPEYEALLRRLDDRDEYLWARYGRPLIAEHRGRWVAISVEGETIPGDTDLGVSEAADARFGAGNYYAARLDESRGAPRLRARSG
jgi:hypothetical protein